MPATQPTAVTPRPIPERTIEVRRPGISYADDATPKYFVADDILRSHIAAMLSSVFPEGEDFFVRSVRNYRDHITDPVLKEQVKGFIGQEALHGREHRAFNQRLQELGYPTRFTDKRVKIGLGILGKVAPKTHQLAVTAALEHYTATLAEALLRDDAARAEFTTDEIRTLFSWHALEETEHKSVAFDVFQHVCGDRRVRVGTMWAVHVGFLFAMTMSVTISLLFDRYARRHPVKVLRSLSRLRTHVFFQPDVLRRLKDYDRPDFHPDDHDTVELLDRWRQELTLQAA
jgi:predicted metal-dependent hydrolase